MLTGSSEQAGEAEHVAEEFKYIGQFLYRKPPDNPCKKKREKERKRENKRK